MATTGGAAAGPGAGSGAASATNGTRRGPDARTGELAKETTIALRSALNNFTPVIPDELVAYLLRRSGCKTTEGSLIPKLVALATQHALNKLIYEAHAKQQYIREGQDTDKRVPETTAKRATDGLLTTEAVVQAMRDNGMAVVAPPYLTDTPDAPSKPVAFPGAGAGASGKRRR